MNAQGEGNVLEKLFKFEIKWKSRELGEY